MASQKLHRDPLQVKFWNAQQGGMGCLRATSTLPNRIIQVEDGWAITNGNVSKGFLHLEIRILEGKDLEAPFNSMSFTGADGGGTKQQETDISNHSAALWKLTHHMLHQLRLEITYMGRVLPLQRHTRGWAAFMAHDDEPECVSCCWHLYGSRYIENEVEKSKKGKEEWKMGLWAVKQGAWGEGIQDGER